MFHFNKIVRRQWGIFFFIILSLQGAVWGSNGPTQDDNQDDCEVVRVSTTPVWTTTFDQASVTKLIVDFQREGLTERKAKGRVGELATIQAFREFYIYDQRYVSLESIFEAKGCLPCDVLRDKADRGIDHVFVVAGVGNQWIDQRYTPVFVESKFRSDCYVPNRTIKTKTSCGQMSSEWLSNNVHLALQRVGGKMKFASKNVTVNFNGSQEKLYQFYVIAMWLDRSIQERSMLRYLTLLCPNGTWHMYPISGD